MVMPSSIPIYYDNNFYEYSQILVIGRKPKEFFSSEIQRVPANKKPL